MQLIWCRDPQRFKNAIHCHIRSRQWFIYGAQVRKLTGANYQTVLVFHYLYIAATAKRMTDCIYATQMFRKLIAYDGIPVHTFNMIEEFSFEISYQRVNFKTGELLGQLELHGHVAIEVKR
ncbi:hypothetical protein PHLH6_26610 [Pseudomonas sp. Seg1]|nr:hypothetical protein PHLH6_26610 [Pseudomonas sp. Seg1]